MLGLIQVMQHLDNIQEVGRGIAVAFVATIYGVGIANLFFLPIAGKMRLRLREDFLRREMMLEGVISILEGMNPRMLEVKLTGFLDQPKRRNGARRMRTRESRSRVTHDRWLVSYADFITLLFAFFVVLFASAKADQKKQAQVAQAIDAAFKSLGIFPDTSRQPVKKLNAALGSRTTRHPHEYRHGRGRPVPSQSQDDLESLRRDLEQRLSNQVAQHTVSIQMGRDGLVISLREAGFFDSGSATPRPETMATLRQIAALARPHSLRPARRRPHRQCSHSHRQLRFQLGTLLGARHPHCAALSRSSAPFRPDRLSAAGYAEFHPVASNATPEGRAANRRVDLVVLPRTKIDFSDPRIPHPTGKWQKITDGDERK